MPIKTDCYLAVLKKFKTKFPDAHFEVITRTANHVLSPSWQLLEKYKKEGLTFDTYTDIFCHEMERSECQHRMKQLEEMAREKDVYLVCYEKSDEQCHRRLVKRLIEGT